MRNALEWLEDAARRLPDKPAVADDASELTFSQLLRHSRGIGTCLSALAAPGSPIACYLEKSPQALCAMLGAAYARCCYSIVDVRQPASRAQAIVERMQAPVVIADAKNIEVARDVFAGYQVLQLEDIIDFEPDSELLAGLRAASLDIDPLYINFTSGSTGEPKGVVVCHRSVIDFIGSFVSIFGIREDDIIANQAPFDFDVSVKDIYGGLATGATVQLIPREYFSVPAQLMDYLADHEVTICTWAVSAMCFVSMMGGFEYRTPATIREVIFSGEVMPPKQLVRWQDALPDATFVNVYGPTEITCNCTYHVIDRRYSKGEEIPMGRPFPNEDVFLLDENDQRIEESGVEGEICVCGTCLALGYYNDPERTAAVFVPNPLTPQYPQVMYRTGDIGALDDEGRFVYRGRKDHQIKHLGQRIELGEIDAAAQGADGVSRACTLYDARKKRILMYYVGERDKESLTEELRVVLPQYMVPNRITQLESMPLTKNGKIDRTALFEM